MATTTVANGANISPIWVQEKVISQYAERENFFAKYMGEGPNSIIQVVNELKSNPGDTVKVHVFSKLGSEGVDADATLEGNEEALTPYTDTLYLGQKRNAVRLAGRLTEQRSAINLRKQAGHALGVWGKDLITELLSVYLSGRRGTRTLTVLPTGFSSFGGNSLRTPDSTHVLWAGSAATEAGLAATDKMTAALLDKAIAKIRLLINSGIPMRPADGQGNYLCVISPEQEYDLWQDADFVAAQLHANVRGGDNPLFSGAIGRWKNLIIVVNPAAVLFTTSGSVAAAQALILGAQAGAWVKGKEAGSTDGGGGSWRYVEKEFDFDNQIGFAVASLFGIQKLQFNSKDQGVFSVVTGYTSI
ncbi:MAG: N4-gp56 family major capsid protein [Rhodospirillaceae bacterium]